MLDLVNCKVLSIIKSDEVDAYLLSESSMFIHPHKLILKTCGTTTLLSGLPRILEIAANAGGFLQCTAPPSRGITVASAPYRVFYSRKNFLFPDRQHGPHRSWRDEVRSLDKLFVGGSAYTIGKMNGEHWYLYLTKPNTLLTPPASPVPSESSAESKTKLLDVPDYVHGQQDKAVWEGDDETLEILMTDLDEENAKQFYLDDASAVAKAQYMDQHNGGTEVIDVFSDISSEHWEFLSDKEPSPPELSTEGHALGEVVSRSCGLSDVYPKSRFPDSRIDAYQFTPCGFSANGVIPDTKGGEGTHYFTVHVTPEPGYSYASFETNVPASQNGGETADTVDKIVKIFKPGRFSVTFFEAKTSLVEKENLSTNLDELYRLKALEQKSAIRNVRMDSIKGYRRVDRIVHDLDGYDLVFRYYERNDWKGGAPRIGERGF